MAYTAAVVAIAGAGYSIYSGEESKKQQKTALWRQERAQQEAKAAAISQRRQAESEVRRQNKRKPDVGALLEGARQAGKSGTGSTLLGGGSGSGPSTAPTRLLGG